MSYGQSFVVFCFSMDMKALRAIGKIIFACASGFFVIELIELIERASGKVVHSCLVAGS